MNENEAPPCGPCGGTKKLKIKRSGKKAPCFYCNSTGKSPIAYSKNGELITPGSYGYLVVKRTTMDGRVIRTKYNGEVYLIQESPKGRICVTLRLLPASKTTYNVGYRSVLPENLTITKANPEFAYLHRYREKLKSKNAKHTKRTQRSKPRRKVKAPKRDK